MIAELSADYADYVEPNHSHKKAQKAQEKKPIGTNPMSPTRVMETNANLLLCFLCLFVASLSCLRNLCNLWTMSSLDSL